MRNGSFLSLIVLASTTGLASGQQGQWNQPSGWGYPPSYGYFPAYGGSAMPTALGYNPYSQPVARGQVAAQPYGTAPGYGAYPQAPYAAYYGTYPQAPYAAYGQPGYGAYAQPGYGPYAQPGYGADAQPGYGAYAQPVAPMNPTANAPAQEAAPDLPAAPLPRLTPRETPNPILSEVTTETAAPSIGSSQPAAPKGQNGDGQAGPLAPVVLDAGDRSAGAGAGGCGPFGRVWISAEPILWWIKGSNLPPLATTGPANPAQVPPPGAVGANGTIVLFGGNGNNSPILGGRFTAGAWLNQCQTVGIEGGYFFLGSPSNNFTAGSSGAPGSLVLARPFYDVSTGMPNSELLAFPGLAAGSVGVQSTSRLQGAQTNLLCNLCCSCPNACLDDCKPARGYRLDLISGASYLELREGLGISENTLVSPTSPVFAGDNIRVVDQFDTRNRFYGGQLGLRAMAWRNHMFALLRSQVALGDNHQTVAINGSTTIASPGGSAVVLPGGLLALPSNIGHYSRDQLTFVPEMDFNLGYQVTKHLGVFVGYTFLYANNVVRPGDVIDLGVNSTRVPTSLVPPSGPLRPQFTFQNSDFWAQGINLGVWLRF